MIWAIGVLVALALFMAKKTGHSDVAASTDKSAIKQMISDAAVRYGVDPALALAVAQQESNFNQAALSSAGAIGVFQLEPGTAADLNVDPYDIAQNIDGGVRYLNQMLGKYGGDVSLALAAYNAGPGSVDKYGGVPPFAETQNYVASVIAKQEGYANA